MSDMNAFLTLLHAHDLIWEDRTWPLNIRTEVCDLLWSKAIAVSAGSALSVEPSQSLISKELAREGKKNL